MVRVTKSYVTRVGSGASAIAHHSREIGDGGLGVQAGQHVVSTGIPGQLEDLRAAVVQVAEHDRLGRARLLARGHDLAVPHVTVLEPRPVLRPADPLDTE